MVLLAESCQALGKGVLKGQEGTRRGGIVTFRRKVGWSSGPLFSLTKISQSRGFTVGITSPHWLPQLV